MKNDFLHPLIREININSKFSIDSFCDGMSNFQKKVFNNLIADNDFYNNYSLIDLIFDFDVDFIEKILNFEIDHYLKSSSTNSIPNKKNGTTKDICLTIGNRQINFNRPRLRKEKDFDSVIIPKKTRIIKDISDNILLLYSKNNSVNDIKDILTQMFGISISSASISNFVNEIAEEVLAWRCKELQKAYFTVNIDCTYISIRDNKNLCKHKIPIYIAIGTSFSGHKEIIGTYLGNEDEEKLIVEDLYNKNIGESKNFWTTVFNDLLDRGCEHISFVSSDGINGIENAIKDAFPNAKHQRCIVHLVSNLKKVTPTSLTKFVLSDFKKIYNADTLTLANIALENFKTKYCKNKTIVKKVIEYFTFIEPLFNESENIRKYIYTNNISESANSKLKRGFYGRGALPNANSALNIIYFNLIDLEKTWNLKKVNNWDSIFKDLTNPDLKYYNQIKNYL